MKRFLSALTLCSSLLVLLSFVLFPHVAAQKDDKDVLAKLLSLPAPPPPNPFIKLPNYLSRKHDSERESPPPDDAPIEDQIEFWTRNSPQPLRYNPEPSDKVRALLLKEIESDPSLLPSLMSVFNNDLDAADTIKRIYDSEGTTGVFDKETRKSIKTWLTFNSPYYSNDLERTASQITDTSEYLTSQDELLALTRVDFDKARPIIDRLYGDGSLKTSRVLAKWALYRRALLTNSTSDIERYRDELKDVVEDKSALAGMRDLAFDALVSEKDWAGRDEWYYSLMADETLAELRVSGSLYTGLTTIVLRSPSDKYTAKMIELLKSDNAAVRSAAVRNLMASIERGGPEIVKALLPWLENPKWATDVNDARGTLVRKLAEYEMPESVPGLIKVLEEKRSGPRYAANIAANAAPDVAWNAPSAAANAVYPASNSNRAVDAGPPEPVDHYPFRSSAVYALTTQKDARAAQPLRRALSAVEPYERISVVRALLACNGFTISEQLEAIDSMARRGPDDEPFMGAAIVANYPPYNGDVRKPGPPTAMEIRAFVGQQLIQGDLVSDALARATVDRIEALEKRDPQVAAAYRKIVLAWKNAAINTLFLRDVKRGTANLDTIVRLLGSRKMLREKHSSDVFDVRTGTPLAVGIAACLLEDNGDYEAILDTGSFETKTALLACSRLIRVKLGVEKVAANLNAKQPLLANAAEQYLISEDSPQARAIVLSRHPDEAMILGATTMFAGTDEAAFELISALFMSVGNENLYNGWFETSDSGDVFNVEKQLQEEVKKDATLLGVYAYDDNYIRIYNDRVIYSWDEDDSRYRERPLRKEEFDEIKSYLTDSRADELPPFIYCVGAYCEGKELLMLGRNGGRRVFLAGVMESYASKRASDFFTGLDKYFSDLKREPAKLKYMMSREVPNLEIVLAREDLRVSTVWGQGSEIRIAAAETAIREKVRTEIDAIDEDLDFYDYVERQKMEKKKESERAKRRFEGYAWYRIAGDQIAGTVAQPPGVEFIPLRDGVSVPVEVDQWKARAPGFEIRTAEDGLYKVVGGRATKLLSGNYEYPVVSPDGRWVIVTRSDEERGKRPMRVNLVTRQEYPIEAEEYGNWQAAAYVPSLGRFLIERFAYYDHYDESEEEDAPHDEISEINLKLLDIATGKLMPVAGELRPLAQQTFRPLQKAARPGEMWAALPDSEKNETLVGTLNTRNFAFKQVIRVPKIMFDSMQMWIDEPRKKLYFVYRGHLLSLPLAI
ncbi:MAG: HEAT repeat domain-containing protein [Pyrinomonadaceae bacterium]